MVEDGDVMRPCAVKTSLETSAMEDARLREVKRMDLKSLGDLLEQEGFDRESYRSGGGMPSEGLVLERHGAGWLIEYCERGQCRDVESFEDEGDACERMYALMKRDFDS